MRVTMSFRCLFQDLKSGVFHYRRRVPLSVARASGKNRIMRWLGTSDANEAVRRRDQVRREVEAEFQRIWATPPERLVYEAARDELRGLKLIRRVGQELDKPG